jgi:hypothetical protein
MDIYATPPGVTPTWSLPVAFGIIESAVGVGLTSLRGLRTYRSWSAVAGDGQECVTVTL